MTQLLLLGKFEYTGGPIFKVVLECLGGIIVCVGIVGNVGICTHICEYVDILG